MIAPAYCAPQPADCRSGFIASEASVEGARLLKYWPGQARDDATPRSLLAWKRRSICSGAACSCRERREHLRHYPGCGKRQQMVFLRCSVGDCPAPQGAFFPLPRSVPLPLLRRSAAVRWIAYANTSPQAARNNSGRAKSAERSVAEFGGRNAR